MTKEAVKELCEKKAFGGEPCCLMKGHRNPCCAEKWWCTKHDLHRLYENRPCVDCLTDALNRHEQALARISEPPAKAEDAAQVSEPVARAGFVRLTAMNGCTYWIRADHITKIATSVDGGTYLETEASSERLIEPALVVLERIGKAKGADPLFAATLLNALRKEGAP